MRDLQCFRLLRERRWEHPELPALLDELARLSARQRVPFFGLLLDALWSDDPAAKALHPRALACLGDADGHLVVEAVVAALADDDAREAGVRALRHVALRQPARWVHALMHPSEAVRLLAVSEPPPDPARPFELYALADPTLRARILARDTPPVAGAEAIGAVLEFAASGVIDQGLARTLLRDPSAVVTWLDGGRKRTPLVIDAAFDPRELARSRDDLDMVLDLFWDDAAADALFAAIALAIPLSDRTVLSLLAVGLRRGFTPRTLALLFALAPSMIAWTFLDEGVRRDAITATLARSHALRKHPVTLIQPLFFHDLCTHIGGGPDLRVLVALMTLVPTGDAARELAQWVGVENIVRAISARPAESSAYFELLEKDDLFKKELYAKLPPEVGRAMLHAFVRRAAEQVLGFIANAPGADVEAAIIDLVNQLLPATRARRIAELAAQRLDGPLLNHLFAAWKPRIPASEEDAEVQLGFALLFASARQLETERFVTAVTYSARTLPVILGVIDASTTFPYGKEIALAHAVRTSPDPFVRGWAALRVRPPDPPPPIAVPPADEALFRAVVTCKRVDLPKLVQPYFAGGRHALSAALARRTDNPAPDAVVCAAVLASVDPHPDVDAQLLRYATGDDAFLREVENVLATHLGRNARLSMLGHAVLWRWEVHGKAFLEAALGAWGDLAGIVRGAMALRSPLARRVAIAALADSIAVMSARDKERAAKLVGPELVVALLDALSSDVAARVADALLATWRYTPSLLPPVEARLRELLVDADEAVRDKLSGWVAMVGVPARAPVLPRPSEPDDVTLARVRTCSDVAELGRFCADVRAAIVHEATLRLIELGEVGRAELARILETAGDEAQTGPIAESVTLWDDGPALARARDVARSTTRPPNVRFAVTVALLERGEPRAAWKHLIGECVLEDVPRAWFRPEHWNKLTTRLGLDPSELAVDLAPSSQPHAYLAAVQHLLAHGTGDAALGALRAFLDQGTGRMGSLRRAAAEHLHARGDHHAFPLVMEQQLETSTRALLAAAPRDIVRATTLAFLAAGNALAKEGTLIAHLAASGVDPEVKDEAYETILLHCASDPIRQRAALAIRSGLRRLDKLIRVAETFAWGARIGQELLGKLYRVQMTGGKSLGHTFLKETRIHVTPLPILRGDKHGREIVEALILHELGHHMYHRGPDGVAAWGEAQKEGIPMLLNLVADEHLERNLRALDSSFGDRLKRLASYAFQHSERELNVRALLGHLGPHAFGVLTKTRMRVARDPERVLVDNGEVLLAMEREEMAFTRFMRALRMGLGNRHEDPVVAEALALFEGDFRHKKMGDLLAIARKLRDIFGWQVQLCNSMGPHETLEGESNASQDIIWGEGITQDEVDRMVERVLDPRHRDGPPPPEGNPGRPMINISPKNDFDRITHVERIPFDPAAHRDYAQRVARPARVMRRYLEELGLHHVRQPMRLRGARLDKSRILPLVTRGEPHVLMQRELESTTDLFLGIVIDCSGSMATRDNMERARQFAMLLAEACSGLRGVDLRVFGFTDKVIYDCGDAARCSAYALKANGGNNDAAALFYAANVARASRRKARLLVMISDGLPTECSVAALRELVQTLTRRWHMVCAQVAVQPLAEVCFPHYVVCNDPSIEQTVNRFGGIVMNLVRKTLGR